MEHLICIQCGAEVRPEEAYHPAPKRTLWCAATAVNELGVKTTLGTVIPRCVRHAIPITIRAATNAAG